MVLKYHTRRRLAKDTNLREFFLHIVRTGHKRKSTNDREGNRYRNYDAAFGQILRISKGFHRSMQNQNYFLFDQASKNFKNF